MVTVVERQKFPTSTNDLHDLTAAVEEYILPGFLPPAPLITKTDLVFTLGSCFARNLAEQMGTTGQPIGHTVMEEWINSPLANQTMLDYAIEQRPFLSDNHAEAFPVMNLTELREMVGRAKLLVFTVGLAYCFFSKGKFVVKVNPQGLADGTIIQRLTTVDENVKWLRQIVRLLRKVNPDLKIVFSLSPVPLNTSFTSLSAMTSDCLSKSTLRLALNEFMSQGPRDVYYWPAFEVVRWLSGHTGRMYGDDGNPRHVSKDTVKIIVELFIKHYVA